MHEPSRITATSNLGLLVGQKDLREAFFRVLVYLKRLISSLLPSRRYLFCSPPIFRLQIFFDKFQKKLGMCQIRDFVDFSVLEQIYWTEDYNLCRLARWPEIWKFYEETLSAGKTPWILDCGGNIGLATRYFSENYDRAEILCVEPHPANVALGRINNSSPHVRFLEAAVGCEEGLGSLFDPGQGGNAYQIWTAPTGGVAVVGIEDLLAKYVSARHVPFIVKIDIEGSENQLFSKNLDWIDLFPVLIIELHDWMLPRRGTSKYFLQALAGRDRDFVYFGENIYSLSNSLLKSDSA